MPNQHADTVREALVAYGELAYAWAQDGQQQAQEAIAALDALAADAAAAQDDGLLIEQSALQLERIEKLRDETTDEWKRHVIDGIAHYNATFTEQYLSWKQRARKAEAENVRLATDAAAAQRERDASLAVNAALARNHAEEMEVAVARAEAAEKDRDAWKQRCLDAEDDIEYERSQADAVDRSVEGRKL